MWLGCEVGGRGEADAMFQMRKEEMQFASDPADETARVFGVTEIMFSRLV
jgi:hypothetical protein